MVTIKTYSNPTQAQLDRSLLEGLNIPAFVIDKHSFTLGYGSVLKGGVRLQVEEPRAEEATEILKNQENSDPLPDDFIPPAAAEETPAEPRGYPIWPIIIVAAFLVISAFAIAKKYEHRREHRKSPEAAATEQPPSQTVRP
jgi:hypothetical protein